MLLPGARNDLFSFSMTVRQAAVLSSGGSWFVAVISLVPESPPALREANASAKLNDKSSVLKCF